MIELREDELIVTFPEVHPKARLRIEFQRTLRIPDDGRDYRLPAGLGRFPLRHVDDFRRGVPRAWLEHGGVMLPMYQSEAMWLNFTSEYLEEHGTPYPFAVKVATGKINAISGEDWSTSLTRRPQGYVVVPEQAWIDGYCIEEGVIRQFVAMTLGGGYTAEEQLSGRGHHGGLQLLAYPMRRDEFERRFPTVDRHAAEARIESSVADSCRAIEPQMGLAPGGRMRQQIFTDPYRLRDWDQAHSSRCFVHIANSLVWSSMTNQDPPTVPPTPEDYAKRGLPWFDFYDETAEAVPGTGDLRDLKSVEEKLTGMYQRIIEEVAVHHPELRRRQKKRQVRDGEF